MLLEHHISNEPHATDGTLELYAFIDFIDGEVVYPRKLIYLNLLSNGSEFLKGWRQSTIHHSMKTLILS